MSSGIFHRHWGDGRPIVLLHGLFGSLENLGMLTRQLKDDYSVYALDLPNHGKSAHTADTSLMAMANAVIHWMDATGLPQAHFIGHSLGGKVAMEIALRYPRRVARLVVVDIAPVTYDHRHNQVFAAFHAVDLHSINNRGDADRAMQPHVADSATRGFLLKNLVNTGEGWQWRINLRVLERHYEHIRAGNTMEYPAFDGEVLFIRGEQSNYILPQHQERIIRLFPDATIKTVYNTGHWLHAEKPAIVTALVKRFLNL